MPGGLTPGIAAVIKINRVAAVGFYLQEKLILNGFKCCGFALRLRKCPIDSCEAPAMATGDV